MKTGVDDFLLHPNGGRQRLLDLITNESQPVAVDWADLDVQPKYEALPEFPMDAMPQILGEMAAEIVRSDQVPIEAASLIVLCVAGLAASGWYRASIKRGVFGRPNLYAISFLSVGERKSTMYARALQPVEDWIRARKPAWDLAVESAAIQEKRIEAYQKKLADVTAKPQDVAETRRLLDGERTAAAAIRSPYILADDATIEAMVWEMDQTGGLLGVFTDDARQFLQILVGRYSDGNSQECLFLKAYDGTAPVRSSRRSRKTIVIETPCIAACLMVQLDWLGKLGAVADLSYSGFLSRCLFCVPDSLAGTRDADGNLRRAFTDCQVDLNVQSRYANLVRKLLDEAYTMTATKEVTVDPDARALWIEFYNQIEGELGATGTLHHLADIAKRYPSQALRLALVATLCRSGIAVSLDDMNAGVQLATYFAHHTERAWQAMRSSTLPRDPGRIVDYLKRHKPPTFRLAEVHRAIGQMDSNEMVTAVQWLVEHGYCRPIAEDHKGPGRKPSPRYTVNPKLYTGGG